MNAMPSMDSAAELHRGGTVGASLGMIRDVRAYDRSRMSLRGSALIAALPDHR